jgi:hypothetical protein
MKKGNKNNEMIRNKIQKLNSKPSLRRYLFKQVTNEQLDRELKDEEKKLAVNVDII